MSWPKRLPEEDYDAAIGEAEAYLREHLPKGQGDRSMTWTMAALRFYLAVAEAEGQKAILEAEMSRLEIREEFCRNLIALAKAGDKQAEADLRMLAILFLEDAIAGRDDVAAPRALLRLCPRRAGELAPARRGPPARPADPDRQCRRHGDCRNCPTSGRHATRPAAPRSTRNRRARWSPRPSRRSAAP